MSIFTPLKKKIYILIFKTQPIGLLVMCNFDSSTLFGRMREKWLVYTTKLCGHLDCGKVAFQLALEFLYTSQLTEDTPYTCHSGLLLIYIHPPISASTITAHLSTYGRHTT